LPVAPEDFSHRERAGRRQWNKVSQSLQHATVATDRLQAMLNSLRGTLSDPERFGVTRDPVSRQRFGAEVEASGRDVWGYRKRIQSYRGSVELGRAQVGLGDQRYVDDDRVRNEFALLFAREVDLVEAGGDGADAQAYARSILPMLARIQLAESDLLPVRAQIERKAAEHAQAMAAQVATELAALQAHSSALETLHLEARLVVGEVARRNFTAVRERLKGIVLRADTGAVQQAWEARGMRQVRVRHLQRERASEDRRLNDELREVLDDTEEQQ
ncbi:hypothetical protein ACFL5O_02400, partial [Myxococcota bacterium]